ncbi:hypothetical protein UPYG_G00307480 [Umbra pygmaea]|uniref:Ig-like domain-containing protein n=1 Tax=Umbra pygmaea TaxID=75934 RepID=A0ABD0VYT2_UMBPY
MLKKMGNMIFLVLILNGFLLTDVLSVQVVVPETERNTMLFAWITIGCDYSTSANSQNVIVTWRYKSFCMDPVLDYYSAAYQAALQLGQDPANDCPDSKRIIRTVIQKQGTNQATLGAEYQNRKISIRNKADLVINEIMWWDNGMYFCTINAVGDTTGVSEIPIKLIVYNWLTALLIIIGALLLIAMLCVCCCQCCPQKCCCYVRCPCCPQTCCCPEKAVMQHRMLQEAEKAMAPWMLGQPLYAPISQHSSQGYTPVYRGSSTDGYPTKPSFQMTPMVPSPMPLQLQPPPVPQHQSSQATNQMLDFLERQVSAVDMHSQAPPPFSHYQPQQYQLQSQAGPQGVPFTSGPPSMLSALGEMGVRGVERRVITLPPIVQRVPSFSRRGTEGGGARGAPRLSSQSSGSSNQTSGGGQRDNRDQSPPRRGILRGYSDESDWDDRRDVSGRRGQGSSGRRTGWSGSAPRSRSRDDRIEKLRRSSPGRRDRSYSPPPCRHGNLRADDEDRQRAVKGKLWSENPPSYSSIQVQPGGKRTNCYSDKSSRSGASVVI